MLRDGPGDAPRAPGMAGPGSGSAGSCPQPWPLGPWVCPEPFPCPRELSAPRASTAPPSTLLCMATDPCMDQRAAASTPRVPTHPHSAPVPPHPFLLSSRLPPLCSPCLFGDLEEFNTVKTSAGKWGDSTEPLKSGGISRLDKKGENLSYIPAETFKASGSSST